MSFVVRLRLRTARRKYMHKKTYTYEIYYLEFPRRFYDRLKPFFGRDLRLEVGASERKLMIILELLQDISSVKNQNARNDESRSF